MIHSWIWLINSTCPWLLLEIQLNKEKLVLFCRKERARSSSRRLIMNANEKIHFPQLGRWQEMNYAKSMISQNLPISLLRRHEEDGKELFKISYMCSSLKITLTKNVRGGLMFLDDHMSSSRRNEKHLKVTFAKFAASAAAEAGRGGG